MTLEIIRTDYPSAIAAQLKLNAVDVKTTIELLDEGNTIPFIARYRKEKTGSMDEEQIRSVHELYERLYALDLRREAIAEAIAEQGNLTEEIVSALHQATTLTELEDIYAPYKRKRKTRADVAREKGLQGLADAILNQKTREPLEKLAKQYLSDDVGSIEEAIAGAKDIVAQSISDHTGVRQHVREKALVWSNVGTGKTKTAEDPKRVYETYYDFELRVDKLRPHQVLAINRGEREDVLKFNLDVPERDWRNGVERFYRPSRQSSLSNQLVEAANDSAQRLLLPAIERDVRREITEQAEAHAIQVFAKNLRGLLVQPPLRGYTVLGLDPAFRTGCKLAVVSPTGKVLGTGVIYPHQPQNKTEQARTVLNKLVKKFDVNLIAIGNGTASRESEQFVADYIQSQKRDINYLIVDEAGASVYSASKLARQELPELDVTLRGAVSIARRVQDPLAELVKIDPKSIGVGMYQHDVDQKQLASSLDAVVESVVNNVGVNVNTASPALLTHVSGIGPKLADNIVEHRDTQGPFATRKALKAVKGLGPKAFEQAAGFLRIPEGDDPLDSSAIHPESYKVAKKLIKQAKVDMSAPPKQREQALKTFVTQFDSFADAADALGCGVPTLKDMVSQLIRPGRDPREKVSGPVLRTDVLKMSDLTTGMLLKGTVRNVVDFGCFIDIGVKQDGLLHNSQIPYEIELSVGDVVTVQILMVEEERGRIGLGWPY